MNGFLTKPLTLGRLQSELLRILESQSNSESVSTQMNHIKAIEVDLQESVISADDAEKQVINIDIIHRLQEETSTELFPQMIDLFIEQGQNRINAIVNSIQEHDFKTLASEIHTLKSESTTFGASHLGALSIEVNYLCKQGSKQQAFELATRLKPSWDKTKVAMQNILVT
jgi:HPt (histidine-containing phosphotransfer) domain-containing protein